MVDGIPKLYLKENMNRQINVRVSEEDYKALEEISRIEGRRLSQTARLFIRRYLAKDLDRISKHELPVLQEGTR
jgi:hypothetical protein